MQLLINYLTKCLDIINDVFNISDKLFVLCAGRLATKAVSGTFSYEQSFVTQISHFDDIVNQNYRLQLPDRMSGDF